MHEDFVPSQGRTVVYGYPSDTTEWSLACAEGRPYEGPIEWRPAQIVKVWTTQDAKTVNLIVFLDGSNDGVLENGASSSSPFVWKTSVMIDGFGEGVNNVHRYAPRVPLAAAPKMVITGASEQEVDSAKQAFAERHGGAAGAAA